MAALKRRQVLFGLIAAMVAAVVGAEAALRLVGAGDVPLYRPDANFGYVPIANQAGAFLGRDWAFNERSLGVAEPFRAGPRSVLLVGDSIVAGTNWLAQAERLGPQLERRLGADVWPAAAGSWGLANELAFLQQNADLVSGTGRLVFVLNSADFGRPSYWAANSTLVGRRPVSVLFFHIADELALRRHRPGPAPGIRWQDHWPPPRPALVVLFPTRAELADPDLRRRKFEPAEALKGPDIRMVDVAADPRWRASFYRDEIHPGPEGTAMLADIIEKALGPVS